jgi:hypothetical protein
MITEGLNNLRILYAIIKKKKNLKLIAEVKALFTYESIVYPEEAEVFY